MPEFTSHTPEFWDERYRSPDFIYGTAPNLYLAAQLPRLQQLAHPGATAPGPRRR